MNALSLDMDVLSLAILSLLFIVLGLIILLLAAPAQQGTTPQEQRTSLATKCQLVLSWVLLMVGQGVLMWFMNNNPAKLVLVNFWLTFQYFTSVALIKGAFITSFFPISRCTRELRLRCSRELRLVLSNTAPGRPAV